jgi:hypothetical protein
VTAAEEGKPEALGALQGASGEWKTTENEANLVRQRCNMRKPFESNSRRGGEKPRGRRPSCSTWRWHDLARVHRILGSGSKGEVGGEALQEDESSREVRTDGHGAELTRRFTSVDAVRKSPRGGIGASNVNEQTVPRAFACVVSDAKDMGAVLDDCCRRQS